MFLVMVWILALGIARMRQVRADAHERPIRVVLAPSAYYPHVGGIEETTRQLALAYRRLGHSVSVLTNRWPQGVREYELLDSVEVTRLAFPLPAANAKSAVRFLAAAPAAIVALIRHVRAERPDVLHVIGAGPQAVYVSMLYRWLGVRVIFTGQGELTFDAHRVFQRSATLRLGLRRMLRPDCRDPKRRRSGRVRRRSGSR